jgi:hypothetical protein
VGGPKWGILGPIWWFPDDILKTLQCFDLKFYIQIGFVCGEVGIENEHHQPADSPSNGPKGGVLGPILWFLDDNLRRFSPIVFKFGTLLTGGKGKVGIVYGLSMLSVVQLAAQKVANSSTFGIWMITAVTFEISISNFMCGFYMGKHRSRPNLG